MPSPRFSSKSAPIRMTRIGVPSGAIRMARWTAMRRAPLLALAAVISACSVDRSGLGEGTDAGRFDFGSDTEFGVDGGTDLGPDMPDGGTDLGPDMPDLGPCGA